MKKITIIVLAAFMIVVQACNQNTKAEKSETMNKTEQKEQYTFQLSDKVTREKVTFKTAMALR